MAEKNFEFNTVEFEDEVSSEEKEKAFEDFNKKESVVQKETEGFLMKLVPEKFKREAVAYLAALSIFTSASSAFAEGFKEEEINKEQFPENQTEEIAREKLSPQELFEKMIATDKNDELTPFDWKKITDKIEISVGGEMRETSRFDMGEAVKDFYGNYWYKDVEKISPIFSDVFKQSQNASDFFHNLENAGVNLNDRQKMAFLSEMGNSLYGTYNFDMLESGQRVEISDEKMFQSLKEEINGGDVKTGICSSINVFLAKAVEKIGMEAWLQVGGSAIYGKQSVHVLPGLIAENDGKKQIMYLDYGTIIPTGTLNFRDASGILEKHLGAVDVFNSFVGDESEILFPVKSRAQEVIEKATGIEETEERMEEELSIGELKKESGLEIKLSPEIKEMKLTKDHFGIAYFNFQDVNNNPYQSLEELSAIRGKASLKGERLGIEADTTILHMNIKDLYEEKSAAQDEIIARIAVDYVDNHKFTKKEYGQFALHWGATLQEALRLLPEEGLSGTSGTGEGALGARLIYINPNETGKFYIGVSEILREQRKDYLAYNSIVKEVAKSLTVGAGIKVNEAEMVSAEVAGSELDWGRKTKIKGGIAGKEWQSELEYEKSESAYKRFIPSSEKISAEIGYQSGPKYMIKILGSKTTEEYAGAESNDIYGAEVKLILFLW